MIAALSLRLLLCLGLLVPAILPAAEKARPNVLFIIADDLNTSLGSYGHPLAKTPNLDKLAARGVRFEKAACQFPLCGPSRNSMLTGLYPNTNGILTNGQLFRQTIPSHQSLSQAFRLSGYFAARIGKLYHYNVPLSIGTNGHDDPGSWEMEINPTGSDRMEDMDHTFSLIPGSYGGTLSWYASPNPDEKHTDGLMAREAAWVLERCAKDKSRPFFLALGFFRPHTPYIAPKTWFEGYPVDKMPVVQGVKEDQADLPKHALGSYKKEQDNLTDDLRRQALQAYLASISFMDAQAGVVLDTLDRLGLSENTVVVFTSDHGYHLGEHGLWQKQSLFEESARVPLIMAGPGVTQGAVAQAPVGLIDLYPTLAELCGVKAPANLQGQSLVPMLKDPKAEGRGWVISQVVRGGGFKRMGASAAAGDNGKRIFGYSLRTPRWRYTEWAEGKEGRELYDHDTDPKELTNLAEKPGHAATVTELSTQLAGIVKTTYPTDGVTPKVKETGMWAPNLTDP
ncbi:MAG TPA: iduronate-2-sulfatase [Verrucomicrobiales bacterium]|nr:iduronate-2-sulfatase [Verrucomicrobiales bacterium]